uniref:YqaJ viral recombinase domain-containing protein n=1 Tax=Oncorhynchus tshawytscha TaxID=74940 RepID=A0AAZ3SX73_ONCTS
MSPRKTKENVSHTDSSALKSPPKQRHINKGSTLNPSNGSGDSGTSRATASQAREAEANTDIRYAKKNIPTVRYHPDIAQKRPEAHQHSHSPDKSSQVRGKPVVSPPRTNQIGGSSMVSPLRPKALPLGLCQKVEVEAVELQTRGQRENPSWFSWRQNRITASVAHRLAHSRFVTGQSTTPPASYLAAITGRGTNVKTRAMTWGIKREAEAVQRYQSLKSKALGRAVRVQECGLFIDPQRPWLAGSPDGIVEDQRTGQRLLCLEVKCPYKHRQNTVAQACREDPAFCLTIQDQGEEGGQVRYHLKPDHSYFTQIQCQLAVTGLTQADLVVFTLKETAIVPVTFDPVFWDETLAKLEMFYTDAVLPYIRDVLDMRPEE